MTKDEISLEDFFEANAARLEEIYGKDFATHPELREICVDWSDCLGSDRLMEHIIRAAEYREQKKKEAAAQESHAVEEPRKIRFGW